MWSLFLVLNPEPSGGILIGRWRNVETRMRWRQVWLDEFWDERKGLALAVALSWKKLPFATEFICFSNVGVEIFSACELMYEDSDPRLSEIPLIDNPSLAFIKLEKNYLRSSIWCPQGDQKGASENVCDWISKGGAEDYHHLRNERSLVFQNDYKPPGSIYKEKRMGPKVDPWGTPQVMGAEDEKLLALTEKVLFLG